jgi:hypothetical protein
MTTRGPQDLVGDAENGRIDLYSRHLSHTLDCSLLDAARRPPARSTPNPPVT